MINELMLMQKHLEINSSMALAKWYSATELAPYIHVDLATWLLDRSSLTSKLSKAYNTSIKIDILENTVCSTHLSNNSKHYKEFNHQYLLRRVHLKVSKVPIIYASSIISSSFLQNRQHKMYLMSNQPLGKFLFSNAKIERSDFEVTCINAYCLPKDAKAKLDKKIWGRRSLFFDKTNLSRSMLVSEYFLNDIFNLPTV